MKTEIRIPAVGESINEATISAWLKRSGDLVKRDEVLLTLETDKANVDVVAEQDGILEIKADAGSVLPIKSIVGFIDSNASVQPTKRVEAASHAPEKENESARSAKIPSAPPQPAKAAAANGGAGKIDIKVPTVGESITEATIAAWTKKNGEFVNRDDVLLSLETDKATVDVVAEIAGTLEISAEAGTVVKIGAIVGSIRGGTSSATTAIPSFTAPNLSQPVSTPAYSPGMATGSGASSAEVILSPSARRVVAERGIDPNQISGTGKGGRIMKSDAEIFGAPAMAATPSMKIVREPEPTLPPRSAPPARAPQQGAETGTNRQRRVKMTSVRKRIAERLVYAQQTAAILTTFNEINMRAVVELRARYKESFKERYGVGLGYMGLFVKACNEALRAYPEVNAFIEGDEIVYNESYNVGVAVGGPKGLIVPVLHRTENMSLAEIELKIKEYAEKARAGKITIEDLSGGTFTISNGGTYGSLMSTPILNPPQSGILGMHKIEDRPIAVNGKVEIQPMMYVALSYDHRIIDGEGAVKFLVKVKEALEDPNRILLEI